MVEKTSTTCSALTRSKTVNAEQKVPVRPRPSLQERERERERERETGDA